MSGEDRDEQFATCVVRCGTALRHEQLSERLKPKAGADAKKVKMSSLTSSAPAAECRWRNFRIVVSLGMRPAPLLSLAKWSYIGTSYRASSIAGST